MLVTSLRLLLSSLIRIGWVGKIIRMSANDLLRIMIDIRVGTGALMRLDSVFCGLLTSCRVNRGLVANSLWSRILIRVCERTVTMKDHVGLSRDG